MGLTIGAGPEGPEIRRPIYTFNHWAQAEFIYADYDVMVSGDHNGRVLHYSTTHALAWSADDTPQPAWISYYRVRLYSAYYQTPFEETAYPGCAAPLYSWAHISSHCAYPGEYSPDSGVVSIDDIGGLNVLNVYESAPTYGPRSFTFTP